MATEKISTSIIADDAVTTAKVADDAITGALIENNPTIAGNLTVSGTSTLTGNSTVGGTLATTGAFTASGGIANAGTISAGTIGSSVTVPASVGSSMVLIKNLDISGTPSTVVFDNSDSDVTFDTTYDNYVFLINNILPTDNGASFYCRVRTNGTDQTSSYFGGSTAFYTNNSSNGTTYFDSGSNYFWYLPEIHHNKENGGISASITLYAPADSTLATSGTIPYAYYRSNNNIYGGCAVARHRAAALINGIKFWWGGSSGTFKNSGSISMYGIKNA